MRSPTCRTGFALCLLALASAGLPAQEQTAGGITIYQRIPQLEIRDTGQGPRQELPLKIAGSAGLKVAFVARGTGGITSVPINMFDGKAQDNTTAKEYAWIGDSWRPVLYRCDRFRYNGASPESTVRPETAYESLLFHGAPTPGNAGVLSVRNLVIYRGEDVEPPQAPGGLAIDVQADGARLSWQEPKDNVGVALYVVSRASGDGAFSKVAETSVPSFVDTPSVPGSYRYRVLAADFQNNLSPWSESVAAQVTTEFPAKPLTDYESDRVGYASYVRQIHDSGRGRVVPGRVLQFGDSLTGALLYKLFTEAELGRYMVDARGRQGWTSGQGRGVIADDLKDVNPEFCLILFGTNNDKGGSSINRAMDDLLAIAKACASRGTVPVIGTIPPRGFSDAKSKPEAAYNAAVAKMCRTNHIPVAYIFEELQTQPDRRKYLADDGIHWAGDGFEMASRAWRKAMDQVNFAVLDRAD